MGDGLDPAVCRQRIAALQQKKTDIEKEAEILQQAEDDVVPLKRNLTLLRRLRSKRGGGFERLPFGVQRQIILAFVEGISVRERREVAIHLRLTLDNGGIQHLCDEMDAADSGGWTDTNEGFSEGESAGDKADALDVPSGPTWRPRSGRRKNSSDRVNACEEGKAEAGESGAAAGRVAGSGVAADAR